jgi:hypothetical protein
MKMKFSKLFKYGLLAASLLGNSIAMEDVDMECSHILNSPNMMKDVSRVIVSTIPFRERFRLASTCKAWNLIITEYNNSLVPFKVFKEINFNIDPDLRYNIEGEYEGDIMNFGCMPQSLCVFLPFQAGATSEEATTWDQTTGWSIDGYTWQAQPLTPIEGEISWCCNLSHPQGTILGGLDQPLRLLTVNGSTIQINPAFPGIAEAEGFGQSFPNLLCNRSNVVFIRNENNQDMISCYNLTDVKQKRVAILPSRNSRAYNFGEKLLVTGSYPNSLQVINPTLDALIEKPIGLPAELISNDVTLFDLTSDQDSILITAHNSSQPKTPLSYVVISNISSEQPKTAPFTFLSKGYKSVGCYLKNNYIFSVACLIVEEEANPENVAASNEIGDTLDLKIDERQGVFAIHDLNSQLIYKKFFACIPFATDLVGNTIFVNATVATEKVDCNGCDSEDCPGYFLNDRYSILGFNIKNFRI